MYIFEIPMMCKGKINAYIQKLTIADDNNSKIIKPQAIVYPI